jgi:hypothetical protein
MGVSLKCRIDQVPYLSVDTLLPVTHPPAIYKQCVKGQEGIVVLCCNKQTGCFNEC